MSKNKTKNQTRDPKKEQNFKDLAKQLTDLGFTVRREKLKQGFGWRVLSGTCQVADQGLVFVDSRLSQDEQISFLSTKLNSVKIGSEIAA